MTTFQKSLLYLKTYRWRFALALICSSVAALGNPGLAKIVGYLFDEAMGAKNTEKLYYVVVAVIALFIVKGIAMALSRYMMFSIGHHITYEIRRDLYNHMVRLPLSYFERIRTGQIMARSTTDVPVVQGIMIQLHHGATDSLRIIFATLCLVYLHPTLTLSIFLIAPPVALAVRFISGRLRKIGKVIQSRLGDINSSLQETILGIREIKAFVAEDREKERFGVINRDNLKMNLKGAKYQAINSPVLELMVAVAMSIVLWLGAQRVIANELTSGDFITYLILLGQMFDPMRKLVDVFNNVKLSLAAFDRIFLFLEEPVTISDRKDAIELTECKGNVTFEHVSFAYSSDEEKSVLSSVNLSAPPGKVVAIVGPSGAGKSTLVNLVPRFYDVTDGSVLVDGHDVRDVSLRSLRSHFGVVPQETILFSGTVRDNISLGRPEATAGQVEQAAKDANAHEFIASLPEGYDTQIGERGLKLSGGQRQRLAIARALLKDPKILILDEATSSLDTDSEKLVQEALDRLMKNRTTFVIAHRLSTITSADTIIVLDRGKICEQGTHEELLEKEGLYHKLCQAQFQAA